MPATSGTVCDDEREDQLWNCGKSPRAHLQGQPTHYNIMERRRTESWPSYL